MTKLRKGLSALLLSAFMTLGVGIGIGTKNVVEGKAASQTVTYKIASKTAVTTSGTAPTDSTATYTQTYGTMSQMTEGNSTTLTLSNYESCKITGLVLSMRSNKSKGAGTFSFKAGSTILSELQSATNFNNWFDNKSYGTNYRDVNVTLSNSDYIIQNGEDLVVTITGTTNSLYIQSYTLTYELLATATKIQSVELTDSSKIFYCGETINKSDFVVKDDTGSVVENFDIDVTTVPSTSGSFNITFTSEGLESKTVAFNATTTAKSVTITPDVLNITQGYVGHTEQLTALVAYNNSENTDSNVTWSSSDANAVIDENGLLQLNSESGTATITATAKVLGANNVTISNSITVTWSNLKDQSFKKMTSDTVLKAGYKVIITNSAATAVMGYYASGSNIKEITEGFTVKNDSITVQSDTQCVYTLVGDSTTGFSFKDGNGQYIYAASLSKNQLMAQNTIDDNAKFDVTYTDSGITIKAKGANTHNLLRYNSNNGNEIFSCYESGQQPVQLYVQNVDEKTLNLSAESLSGVVGQGTTEIKAVFENWTPTTFNWTSSNETIATIEGGETATITPLAYGETTITLTASDGTNTLEASNKCVYTVTVLPEEIKLFVSDVETYEIEIPLGDTSCQNLPDASVLPEGSSQDVEWSIVSGNNVVRLTGTRYYIEADGTAVIRATSTVNPNVYKDFTITVTPNVVESLSVSGTPSMQYTSTNLDLTGLTFTAKMSNTGDKIVNSNDITFSPSIMPNEPIENLEITATYGEKTCTFNVNVIQAPKGFSLLTDASVLNAGDKIIITNRENGAIASEFNDITASSTYLTGENLSSLTSSTTFIEWDKIIATKTAYEIFTLGGSKDAWTLTDILDEQIKAGTSGGLTYASGTWKISVDTNTAKIESVDSTGYFIKYNSDFARFTTYKASSNVNDVEIFYMPSNVYQSEEITIGVELSSWAINFDTEVSSACDPTGISQKVSIDAWLNVYEKYESLSEKAKLELKNTVGSKEGNIIEKSIWYYDYILGKYGTEGDYDNFMERDITKNNISIIKSTTENVIPLIVIISLVSVSSIGGYLFIRKRKEQ